MPLPFGAEQRDAVVGVDAQVEPPQHRLARLVADRDVVERDDRRRQRLLGRRESRTAAPRRSTIAAIGSQLRQHLDARLRLARLGGLGAEAVDEGLQVLALAPPASSRASASSAWRSARWRSNDV